MAHAVTVQSAKQLSIAVNVTGEGRRLTSRMLLRVAETTGIWIAEPRHRVRVHEVRARQANTGITRKRGEPNTALTTDTPKREDRADIMSNKMRIGPIGAAPRAPVPGSLVKARVRVTAALIGGKRVARARDGKADASESACTAQRFLRGRRASAGLGPPWKGASPPPHECGREGLGAYPPWPEESGEVRGTVPALGDPAKDNSGHLQARGMCSASPLSAYPS